MGCNCCGCSSHGCGNCSPSHGCGSTGARGCLSCSHQAPQYVYARTCLSVVDGLRRLLMLGHGDADGLSAVWCGGMGMMCRRTALSGLFMCMPAVYGREKRPTL